MKIARIYASLAPASQLTPRSTHEPHASPRQPPANVPPTFRQPHASLPPPPARLRPAFCQPLASFPPSSRQSPTSLPPVSRLLPRLVHAAPPTPKAPKVAQMHASLTSASPQPPASTNQFHASLPQASRQPSASLPPAFRQPSAASRHFLASLQTATGQPPASLPPGPRQPSASLPPSSRQLPRQAWRSGGRQA